MTQQEYENQIAAASSKSQIILDQIRQAVTEKLSLTTLLRQYILLRFMLEESECSGENIVSWAEQSVEKIAGLKKGGLKISDRSGNCAAVSSAVTKKILLLISLQKALGINFPKEAAAEIQTLSELENMIWKICGT